MSSDDEINRLSLAENRVVITKDSDFYDRYTRQKESSKLLYLTTGNISNPELLNLFDKNPLLIVHSLQSGSVVELNRNTIVVIY
jgi:predicted nuclease of predicted toxin-antitoxin system